MTVLARLASLRATVVLLAAATLFAILTTFLPLRFDGPLFLTIVAAFQLNLAACTVRRVATRPHRRLRDWVPDLIHIGLFVLIAGAAVTGFTRTEQAVVLSPGDQFSIDGRWNLTLTTTEQEPENWVSTFRINDDATGARVHGEARVNAPLAVGPHRLYQTAWERTPVVSLVHDDGRSYTVAAGEGFQVNDELFMFERDPASGFYIEWSRNGQLLGTLPVASGQQIGGLTVTSIDRIPRTVITIVRDPGVPYVLAGALVMALAMTAWALLPRYARAARTSGPAGAATRSQESH